MSTYHAEEYSPGQFYIDDEEGGNPPGGECGPFKSKEEAKAYAMKKGWKFENKSHFSNGRQKAQQEIANKWPVLNALENYTGISKMEDGYYAIPKSGNRKGPFKTKDEAVAFIASGK